MKLTITVLLALSTMYIHSTMIIIGHRGACGYEPENTLRSFQRALDLGVAMVELDVYACKTGQLVITHDDDVSITTDGVGSVTDMSFDALRALKVNSIGQIPTLDEVIELVARRIPINIELKGPCTARPVAELIKEYREIGWSSSDFVVSSFDHQQVGEFKKLCPDVKAGVLCEDMSQDIVAIAQEHQAHFIGLDLEAVTEDLVQLAHAAGFLVYVWTVNEKQAADVMRTFHVDGIFSDCPDRV
jgi:glycerophosphoryl diester phosphodiesterase